MSDVQLSDEVKQLIREALGDELEQVDYSDEANVDKLKKELEDLNGRTFTEEEVRRMAAHINAEAFGHNHLLAGLIKKLGL